VNVADESHPWLDFLLGRYAGQHACRSEPAAGFCVEGRHACPADRTAAAVLGTFVMEELEEAAAAVGVQRGRRAGSGRATTAETK
jgi:hypothetical protein